MNLSSVYAGLPVFAQNQIISWYGLYWKQRRYGGVFNEELEKAKDREFFSWGQWKDYQQKKLRRLLTHAFTNVPFYHEKYTRAGIELRDLSEIQLDQLSQLPFLEKEELRANGDTTLLSAKRDKGNFYASSGSTGTPTKIYFSKRFHQEWSAVFEARIRYWADVDRHTPRGMIGGRRVVVDGNAKPPFYRYNIFEKQTYFSAYHISPQNASDYVEGMIRHGVQYMTGYAVSNYLLAKFIESEGIQAPRLKAVITSSEKLTQEMRDTFRRVYQCPTFDSYSGVEACGLISESPEGQLLVSPDVGILELLNAQGQPITPGETGEIVSTGLMNFDQPLIRYRIGDRAKLALDQQCEGGRSMPVIEEISGRVEDVITGPDGRQMVRFHGLFIELKGLLSSQFIQESLYDYTINLVVNDEWLEDQEAIIEQRLISQLGNVKVKFNYLSAIPIGNNGKYKAVISNLE